MKCHFEDLQGDQGYKRGQYNGKRPQGVYLCGRLPIFACQVLRREDASRNERCDKQSITYGFSRTCTELMVLYTTYSDFRQGVDGLLTSVLSHLMDGFH